MANQKSFRVSNFIFSHKTKTYKHTEEMWNDQIQWKQLQSRLNRECHGTDRDAKAMTAILNKLSDPNDEDNKALTSDERQLIYSLFGFKLDGIGHRYYKMAGLRFEDRFAKLLEKLFVNSNNNNIAAKEFKTGQNLSTSIKGFTIDVITNKKIKNDEAKGVLRNLIGKDIGRDLRGLVVEIQNEIEHGNEWRTTLAVRTVARQGKIDINADLGIGLSVNSELSPPMQDLATRILGKTFSLKNYLDTSIAAQGVSLGSSNEFKYLSSFYQYATKSTNFPDVCTFIFSTRASEKKGNETIKRFKNWARFIYELTGVGQMDITTQSGRLVDYLVILQRTGNVKMWVINTKSLFRGMPDEDLTRRNHFSYNNGHISDLT